MAQFTFTGDPGAKGEDRTKGGEIYGIPYAAGQPFTVADDATWKGADGVAVNLVEKLRRHSHFTEGGKPAKATDAPILEAKHRGGGKYAVVRGDDVLTEPTMTKEEAEAFNTWSEADKTAYIAK